MNTYCVLSCGLDLPSASLVFSDGAGKQTLDSLCYCPLPGESKQQTWAFPGGVSEEPWFLRQTLKGEQQLAIQAHRSAVFYISTLLCDSALSSLVAYFLKVSEVSWSKLHKPHSSQGMCSLCVS